MDAEKFVEELRKVGREHGLDVDELMKDVKITPTVSRVHFACELSSEATAQIHCASVYLQWTVAKTVEFALHCFTVMTHEERHEMAQRAALTAIGTREELLRWLQQEEKPVETKGQPDEGEGREAEACLPAEGERVEVGC